tara:strand:+ start:250 stop:1383 length:1134 start_codon:yes stop_codon:yes gene_type:complete
MIIREKEMYFISVVIPCLNEEKTLKSCIDEARIGIKNSKYDGEVIISDNGSTDNSINIALENGARVINTDIKGYGSAIINGIKNAKGKFVIVGDADMTYDFKEIPKFIECLEDGSDLVIGNRFKGGIEKGAMPFLNKYLGNPFLSFIARTFFKIDIGDFHCGLRGIKRSVFDKLKLRSNGMEFASEMIVKAAILNYKIREIPTTLRKPPYARVPHLRPFRDGLRHLYLIFSHTLVNDKNSFINFLIFLFGSLYIIMLLLSPLVIGDIEFSTLTLLVLNLLLIISFSFIKFKKLVGNILMKNFNQHKSMSPVFIFTILIINLILIISILFIWYQTGFGNLNQINNIKLFSIILTSSVYVLITFFIELVYAASKYFIDD